MGRNSLWADLRNLPDGAKGLTFRKKPDISMAPFGVIKINQATYTPSHVRGMRKQAKLVARKGNKSCK